MYEFDSYFAVDIVAARRKNPVPFMEMPSYWDISLDLPESARPLEDVFRYLMATRSPNSLPRGFLNLNLTLSRLLDTELLSACSDDGEFDFACVSNEGVPSRVRFATETLGLEWEGGNLSAIPLVSEDTDEHVTCPPITSPFFMRVFS